MAQATLSCRFAAIHPVAPAPRFSSAAKTLVRALAPPARKGRWAVLRLTVPALKTSILTDPSTRKGHLLKADAPLFSLRRLFFEGPYGAFAPARGRSMKHRVTTGAAGCMIGGRGGENDGPSEDRTVHLRAAESAGLDAAGPGGAGGRHGQGGPSISRPHRKPSSEQQKALHIFSGLVQ